MATTYKTPGVYVEEIPRFPSSVAAVPTSIPVFIGYTKQAIINGTPWTWPVISGYPDGRPTDPVRIESLLQFETIFGVAKNETFSAVLTGPNVDIAVNKTTAAPPFRLYYNMLMYFANGGGPCYVVSVGPDTAGSLNDDLFMKGIDLAEQVDEITMVLVPDAINIASASDRRDVYNKMLAHSAKMQDRFSLMDVLNDTTQSIQLDADDFRNDTLGANNLSFGAAYYPSFKPSFSFSYLETGVTINAAAVNLPTSVQAFNNKSLAVVNNGVVRKVNLTVLNPAVAANLQITVPGFPMETIAVPLAGPNPYDDAVALAALINANAVINPHLIAVAPTSPSAVVTLLATSASTPSNLITIVSTVALRLSVTNVDNGLTPDKVLYNSIKAQVDGFAIELYPSSMMAGIYCAVDSTRGVWKAPANVGVTFVDKLNRNVKDSDQENLNVDPTSGKSIDVIREFPGRGMLVWGARTLDGNSNEWRYVNVRRTFLFIEDSCKKASEFVVFEPNDMNTWLRVKGMISSFLNTLWRDGALAGSKPEQAFFVKVGLGETMTSQDILEGRMIVQIGLAVVRPAEFIILQFEHKLQVS